MQKMTSLSLLAGRTVAYCLLQIKFANNLDTDHVPDLDQTGWHYNGIILLQAVFEKKFEV